MNKLLILYLKITGLVLFLIGIAGAYYGPLEIFVFYLFSAGGRFYYDGFGFGSFWFAALVVQNIGYYIVAALCIPLGIGHLKLRPWTVPLTKLFLWFWLGVVVLLVGNFMALVPAAVKLELSQVERYPRMIPVSGAAFIFLILVPLLGLWSYQRPTVRAAFSVPAANNHWLERFPFPLQALLVLFVLMIISLHLAIFFQSLFPLFGKILLGRPAVYLISLCILILGFLIYGTVHLKRWAWWGALVFVSLMTVTSGWSFASHSFYEIILLMNLPSYEMAYLDQLVLLHDFHLVGLITPPLLISLGLIIFSKQYFQQADALEKQVAV